MSEWEEIELYWLTFLQYRSISKIDDYEMVSIWWLIESACLNKKKIKNNNELYKYVP